MFKIIGIIIMICCGVSFVHAQERARASLPGYRGFLFGMTEEQARSVSELGQRVPELRGRVRLTMQSPVVIDGIPYELSITLEQGHLSSILLQGKRVETDIGCHNAFERALGLVQARYGRPDLPPKPPERRVTIRGVTFTFRDGNSISVNEFFVKDCLVTVAYLRGKKGESF